MGEFDVSPKVPIALFPQTTCSGQRPGLPELQMGHGGGRGKTQAKRESFTMMSLGNDVQWEHVSQCPANPNIAREGCRTLARIAHAL